MAWRRPGDKPLSEPMMVSLPTHICVTRPQWINKLTSVVRRSECHMPYSDKNAWIFSLWINHAAEVYIQNVDIIFNSAGYYDIHTYVYIYYDIYANYSHILARFIFCCLNSRDVFIDSFPGCFIAPLRPLSWRHNGRDGVSRLFAQLFIKAPRHWPLWGEFTSDRWIPHTNGQ